MKINPKDLPLPFADFLGRLKQQGFIIGVDHYLHLQTVLEIFGPEYLPGRLKYLLCPVFATSPKQQEQFYKTFDLYFNLEKPGFELGAEQDVVTGKQKPKTVDEKKRPGIKARKFPYVLAGILCVIAVAVIVYCLVNRKLPFVPDTKPDVVKEVTVPGETETIEITVTPPSDLPPLTFFQEYGDAIRWSCIILPLIVFILWEFYRAKQRKLVLERQRGKKPPFV
ncbi:MAG: hypothetical protein GY749_13795 [Desulfobacteraceae bacterium]|nr:hypothetical protein [Desulfobacteraceae bacterium]